MNQLTSDEGVGGFAKWGIMILIRVQRVEFISKNKNNTSVSFLVFLTFRIVK